MNSPKSPGKIISNRPQSRRLLWFGLGLVIAGLGYWMLQRAAEIRQLHEQLSTAAVDRRPPSPQLTDLVSSAHPSVELLAARSEVAQLRQALLTPDNAGKAIGPPAKSEGALEALLANQRPSDHADFRRTEELHDLGFDTPDHALETFYWVFAGPDRFARYGERLWWNPTGPAPVGFHHVIDLGQGFGNWTGYRIHDRTQISEHEVLFHIWREEKNGEVREEARFVRVGDFWQRMPTVRVVKD